jgi:hypothetical protein
MNVRRERRVSDKSEERAYLRKEREKKNLANEEILEKGNI